ncbi:MAG: ATP-binding protein [Candidatus Limnocylindrales bacterium]
MGDPEAVLLNGLYGVGKTTVLIELAGRLEAAGARYAALDLDWLAWAWPGEDEATSELNDHATVSPLLREHLALVVGNLRRRGNDRFALAGSIASPEELALLRATLAMPVRVVRLTAPIEVVRARLGEARTSGRAADIDRTNAWAAGPSGPDHVPADLVVVNERSPAEVADGVLAWTGWIRPEAWDT